MCRHCFEHLVALQEETDFKKIIEEIRLEILAREMKRNKDKEGILDSNKDIQG